MTIKIQMKHYVYNICIGRQTAWFSQMSFITIMREYYNKQMKVEFASMVWHS